MIPARGAGVGAGGHLGDLLSALLDGELGGGERAGAERHLATCAACRGELDGIAAARAAVRALPALDPPTAAISLPVLPALPALPWWRRPVVATVAAAAAAWLVVLAVGAGTVERTAPPVAAFVSSHDQAATPGTIATLTTAGAQVVPAPWPGTDSLARGWDLVAAVRRGDALQLVYSDGTDDVSVFEQRGELDWPALPPGGEVAEVAGRRVWVAPDGDRAVAVFEDGGMVVTVVAEGGADAALAMVGRVPDAGGDSLLDRARRAARGLVDTFSLRG